MIVRRPMLTEGARTGEYRIVYEAKVRWRPFRPQSELPKGGLSGSEFARQKFGGEANAKAVLAQVAAAGEPDGVYIDFDRAALPRECIVHGAWMEAAS